MVNVFVMGDGDGDAGGDGDGDGDGDRDGDGLGEFSSRPIYDVDGSVCCHHVVFCSPQ